MTETEHAQWIKQFWKDKLDEIKGVDRMSNEYLDIAMEKVTKQEIDKVLGQIRAEVEDINPWTLAFAPSKDKDIRPQIVTNVKSHVLEIIDRYRAEGEET